MAVVQNITDDDRTLFDGRSVAAGDSADVADADFVGRAWPKSTWSVTKPSKDFVDASTDDAYLFVGQPEETVEELRARADAEGVDLTGLTKKADIVAALAKGPATTTPEESA